MNALISPGVARWRQRFAEDPLAALDAALTGRVSLGRYDRARPAEALVRMLSVEDIAQADTAMQTWLEQRLGKPLPKDLSPKRYADALVEAFRAIQLLPLPATRTGCVERHAELRAWLRGFTLGSSRDPEAALLVVLAHRQSNRQLLFMWREVIRRGRPLEHVRLALMGLRLMPADDQGAVERGLPRVLLRGLLDYGETLVKQGDKKGKPWLEQLDFLAAVYPQSKEIWSRRFREVLQGRDVAKDVHNWLDSRFSTAQQNHKKSFSKEYLSPPSLNDFNAVLNRIDVSFKTTIPALKTFFDHHRRYAQDSGDSYYLVRCFCRLGEKLLKHDPLWARELAHEAARWEPSNHHTWSLLARALEAEGDWRRAEAVYWQARRRFPHDAHCHSQLGHALLLHGQEALGEMVFRQATRLFPDNPVTWGELGHSLRVTGQFEQAVNVYKEARQGNFHRDPVIATALTETLIDLNRPNDAEAALQWAEQVVPDDNKNQQILEKIRRRLEQLKKGTPSPPRQLQASKEIAGGDLRALADITGIDLSHAPLLGRAGLWRRQGNIELAGMALAALQDGSAKLIEQGLLLSATDWQAAVNWFDGCWENYAGDGALRVHRLRAKSRAGEAVDWSWEKNHYPELLPVIVTEEQGHPPRYQDITDPGEEQKQALWFNDLAGEQKSELRDWAEEDFLTARQVA